MYKIAVITSHQHTVMGGMETNNRNFYNLFSTKLSITEFPLKSSNHLSHIVKKNKNVEIDDLLHKRSKLVNPIIVYRKKDMEYIYKTFDLVLYRTSKPSRKWLKNPKSIVIQSEGIKYYKNLFMKKSSGFFYPLGYFFTSVLFDQGTLGSPFKKAKNSVFFTKEATLPSKGKSYYVASGKMHAKDMTIKNKKPKTSIWISRMESCKRTKDAIKIANQIADFEIYGAGPDEKYVKLLKNKNQYKGALNNNDVIKKMKESLAFVHTSSEEGFGWTTVEALSAGTPCLLYDSYKSAHFFNKCDAVFILKKGDVEGMTRVIKKIQAMSDKEYKKLSQKAVTFAQNNLSIDSYEKNWTIVLKDQGVI